MTVHSPTTSSAKRMAQLVALILATFALLLSVAPTASASEHKREVKTKAPLVLAATEGCPDGWVQSTGPGKCQPGNRTTPQPKLPDTTSCPSGFEPGPFGCVPSNYTHDKGPEIAPVGCAPGWILGRFGCQPNSYTIDLGTDYPVPGCPDGWVRAAVPGGCLPDNITTIPSEPVECPDGWVEASVPGGCLPGSLAVAQAVEIDGCPDGWVVASVPGGCLPGNIAKVPTGETLGCRDGWVPAPVPGGCLPNRFTVINGELLGCPQGWVPASVPGGCQPGNIKAPGGNDPLAAVYTCPFGDHCDDMVDAIIALGGTCTSDGPDVGCTLPPLDPAGRDD